MSPFDASLAEMLKHFPRLQKDVLEPAVRQAVQQAAELRRKENFPTRKEARTFYSKLRRNIDELERAISHPHFGENLKYEIQRYALPIDVDYRLHLSLMRDISARREGWISESAGKFRYFDELGRPSPKMFSSSFLCLLWELYNESLPDSEGLEIQELCNIFWQAVLIESNDIKAVEDDGNRGWPKQIKEAKDRIRFFRSEDCPKTSVYVIGPTIRGSALINQSPVDLPKLSRPDLQAHFAISWSQDLLRRVGPRT